MTNLLIYGIYNRQQSLKAVKDAKQSKKYQTEQRKRMLVLFENSNHHSLSAQEIAEMLKDENVSMSAIYRNLADMEKSGLICKVSEKNRAGALYQYVNPHSCRGIIHLKCESCDQTYHLDKCVSDMIFAMAENNFSFHLSSSMPILFGQCQKCKAASASDS